MSFQTATRFRWAAYTKTWAIRVFAASVGCSILVLMFATLGVFGFLIGGIISTVIIGAVLLWTVAEMIEDGLPNDSSTTE